MMIRSFSEDSKSMIRRRTGYLKHSACLLFILNWVSVGSAVAIECVGSVKLVTDMVDGPRMLEVADVFSLSESTSRQEACLPISRLGRQPNTTVDTVNLTKRQRRAGGQRAAKRSRVVIREAYIFGEQKEQVEASRLFASESDEQHEEQMNFQDELQEILEDLINGDTDEAGDLQSDATEKTLEVPSFNDPQGQMLAAMQLNIPGNDISNVRKKKPRLRVALNLKGCVIDRNTVNSNEVTCLRQIQTHAFTISSDFFSTQPGFIANQWSFYLEVAKLDEQNHNPIEGNCPASVTPVGGKTDLGALRCEMSPAGQVKFLLLTDLDLVGDVNINAILRWREK